MGIKAIQDLSMAREYLYRAQGLIQQEIDDCLVERDVRSDMIGSNLINLRTDMEHVIMLFNDAYRKALKAQYK